MNSLWHLTKKNIRLLLRTKGSALIVIFAPLLMILVLGLAFNNAAPFGITLGVYSPSISSDVTAFVDSLKEEQAFKVVTYDSSLQECVDDLKLGFVHTCIEVPESLAVQGNVQKEVVFHLDPSKINLVYMVQETVKKSFQLKSKEITQELAQNVLTRLSSTKNKLVEDQGQLQGVRDRTASASGSTESARSSLSAVDASTPATTVDTTALAIVNSSLLTAADKIKAAKDEVAERNISSASEITDLLAAAQDEVEKAKNSLSSSEAGTVGGMISALQADLTATQGKLKLVAESIASSTATLGSTTTTLQESVTALDTVLSSLSALKTDLDAVAVTDANVIASPLVTRIEKVVPDGTYLNYLFPALLVLVVMFCSLLLGSTTVMMEKNSPAYLRNFFLPVNKVTFIISIYCTTLLLTIIQILIILGVALAFLPDIVSALPLTFVVLLLAASVFTFVGMAIGYIFTSEETGLLASISLGSIFLFVSGVILPIESVAPWLRELMHLNPFVIAEKLIREIVLFHSPLEVMVIDFLTLAGYALVLLLVVLIIEAVLHQHLIRKLMRKRHHAPLEGQKQMKSGVM